MGTCVSTVRNARCRRSTALVIPWMAERLRLDVGEQRAAVGFERRADGGDGAPRALQRPQAGQNPNRAILVAQHLGLQRSDLAHRLVAARGVVADREQRDEMLDALAETLQRDLRARQLELIEQA